MILYKNAKVVVHSSDSYTDFFDVVAGVLQRYINTIYIFFICLDNVLWTSINLIKKNSLIIFTQPLRSGRIGHKVNFLKRILTGLNSEYSF